MRGTTADTVNSKVYIRHRKDTGLIEVYDYEGAEECLAMTRVLMALVPPADDGSEPGYACVVGELWDDDPRQKPRAKLLIDEGQALVPEDWPNAEDFDPIFWSEVQTDEGVREIRNCDRPTLTDLRHVAIALKDLYHIETAYIPPTGGSPENPDPFHGYLLQTNGLVYYADDFDEYSYREWFPAYRHREARLGIMDNPPMAQDEDVNKQLVEDLLARDELQINSTCQPFQNAALTNPVRAVGLLCAVFQSHDYHFFDARFREESDGYEAIEDIDARVDERLRDYHKRRKALLWQVGA